MNAERALELSPMQWGDYRLSEPGKWIHHSPCSRTFKDCPRRIAPMKGLVVSGEEGKK